ncbi:hypothetical protein BVY02_02295, partial [bacterium J17]
MHAKVDTPVALEQLLNVLPTSSWELVSDAECLIKGLSLDSRKVLEGDLFFAVLGSSLDGSKFVADAIAKGAAAIVLLRKEENFSLASNVSVPCALVDDVSLAISLISKHFYKHSSDELKSYAITGTNGKTSVNWIISHLHSLIGEGVIQVGTLGMFSFPPGRPRSEFTKLDIGLTTPDSITFSKFVADS